MKSCPICFGQEETVAPHPALSCGHSACQPCLKSWFEACERTGQSAPTCPTCRETPDDHDSMNILGRHFARCELHTRATAAVEEEMDQWTQQFLAENAKVCHSCGAWIVKSHGCEMMQCLCGYRFCWVCEAPGAECNCSPSNHGFWDNVVDTMVYRREALPVASAEDLEDMRSFLEAHAARMRGPRMSIRGRRLEDPPDMRSLLEAHAARIRGPQMSIRERLDQARQMRVEHEEPQSTRLSIVERLRQEADERRVPAVANDVLHVFVQAHETRVRESNLSIEERLRRVRQSR